MQTDTVVLKDVLLRLKGEKNDATNNLLDVVGGDHGAFFIL